MCSSQFFLTKLLTLGILVSTAVKAVVVAKLVTLGTSSLTLFILILREALVVKLEILGISRLNSFILALREALVPKLVISSISSSILFYLSIIYTFFNDIIFLLHNLVYLNQQEHVLICQLLIYLLYFWNSLN